MRWFEEAITAHRDASAIFRETGDRHSEGTVLAYLARAQVARDAYSKTAVKLTRVQLFWSELTGQAPSVY